MDPNSADRGPSTRCVHAGTHLDPATGGACTPIYTSTAYAYPNGANANVYPRYFNTLNQQVISRKLAALEHGEAGLVFSSGMAAISTVLTSHLQPGDHAVFQSGLYGGTHRWVTTELPKWGVEVSFAGSVPEFARSLRPRTRLLYLESPSNPLLRCVNLAAAARLGKEHGLLTVIDNTFATPINQNPLTLGLEVVLHSATKYLNGHSDVTAGVVVASEPIIRRLTDTATLRGGTLDAVACYQLERGLKTLALRMHRHNENAVRLANHLQRKPSVAMVHYPGLADHPDHEVAARQMRGFGGMVAFELKDPSQVDRLLGRLRLVLPALSLGGVESLVCVPARTSHRQMNAEDLAREGISQGLVRVSVGIEDADDILQDFDQALAL